MGFLDDYEPVENRIRDFWNDHPLGRITTKIVRAEDGDYIVRAKVWRTDHAKSPDATGYAHDSVAQLPNNMKASALEVCETSAIGRALANLGYAPKGKRPSREEMSKAAGGGAGKVAPPASKSGVVDGEAAAPDTSSPEGRGTGTPSPSGDHAHEWQPSPRLKTIDICVVEGCGATQKRPRE